MDESGRLCRLGLLICFSAALFGMGGPSSAGIDPVVELDQSGVWKRETEQNLLIGATVVDLGLALWEGSENRLGNTAWHGVDSQLISGVSTEILKRVFTRERPSTTNDPNNWFAGDSNHSFPSGEAASAAALGHGPTARRFHAFALSRPQPRHTQAALPGRTAAGRTSPSRA